MEAANGTGEHSSWLFLRLVSLDEFYKIVIRALKFLLNLSPALRSLS